MKAIGWLLIFIGIGAGIDAYHGNSPYKTLVAYLQGQGNQPTTHSGPTTIPNVTTAPQFGVSK